MSKLMQFNELTGEDETVGTGSTEHVIALADLLPVDWPGIIVHVEKADLKNWGKPDGSPSSS